MAGKSLEQVRQVPCTQCPLRKLETFREFTKSELAFVSEFKRGELIVARGATILVEGSHNPHLYTVLSGIGFRSKILEDGRRQIVNYLMAGDLVGLQGSLMGEMEHTVEALTPMVLCVFERDRLMSLYSGFPTLAFDITWIGSREQCMLDENLLTVGRRSALERVAYLIAFLVGRIEDVSYSGRNDRSVPITQQHVADTLGLSLVHTNKTIRRLAQRGLIAWRDGRCTVNDLDALRRIAGWERGSRMPRPFI